MAQVTSDVSSETLDPKAKVAKVTVDDDEKPKASVYKVRRGSIDVCKNSSTQSRYLIANA